MSQYDGVSRQMNQVLASDSGWQLRLFGKFSLTSPSGDLVRLPDRKTEGLLAILALSREYGIERQAVADILWPSSAPKNLANLRRSLSLLRQTLGAESIESTVHHCRLASGLQITSDFEQPSLRCGGGFLPGHEGDWFEDMRLESVDPGPDAPTVVDHFLQTLRWCSEFDPRGMYALLSAAPAMGRSIPYTDMSTLIQVARGNEACLGWHSYWRGTVEDDLAVCIEHLRLALRTARQTDDLPLASEACLELGKVYMRTGQLAKALRLCDIADVVAAKSRARTPTTNALRLRGTVLISWHDPAAGLDLLMRAEERIEDPIEFAYTKNLRAFFEASLGHYEKADVTLAQSLAHSGGLGHFRIGLLSAFTRSVLDAVGRSRSDAVGQLQQQSDSCYASGATQFGVYADEFLAEIFRLDGDKGSSAQRTRSAKKGRVNAQMARTPLEARRVAAVATRDI